MENTYMKRCSTLLVMTEIHIQATMRQHTIIMALNSFFLTVISVGKDLEMRDSLSTVGEIVIWCNHCGKQQRDPYSCQNKTEPPSDPAIPILNIHPKGLKTEYQNKCL